MPVYSNTSARLYQHSEFIKAKKLIEAKFYKVGDKFDLPLTCADAWSDFGSDFNSEICHPNGLDLQDSGLGYWFFAAFP